MRKDPSIGFCPFSADAAISFAAFALVSSGCSQSLRLDLGDASDQDSSIFATSVFPFALARSAGVSFFLVLGRRGEPCCRRTVQAEKNGIK